MSQPRSTRLSPTEARREVQAKLNLAAVSSWPIAAYSARRPLGRLALTETLVLVKVAYPASIPREVVAIARTAKGYRVAFH